MASLTNISADFLALSNHRDYVDLIMSNQVKQFVPQYLCSLCFILELRCSCFPLTTKQTSCQRELEGQTQHNVIKEANKNDKKEQIS